MRDASQFKAISNLKVHAAEVLTPIAEQLRLDCRSVKPKKRLSSGSKPASPCGISCLVKRTETEINHSSR